MSETSARGNGTITISATFTAESLLSSLNFVLQKLELSPSIYFSPYNQVFQELLSGVSSLATNANGVNIILVRVEDFVREVSDIETARAIIATTARELSVAFKAYAQRAKVPTVLAILPPSPSALPSVLADLEAATAQLTVSTHSLPGIVLLSADEIELVSTGERFDQTSDELAHVPFTQVHFASLGLALARKVHALLVPPHKVLVLDCDNTLWRGVVGEDGVDGVAITLAFASLQQFAVKAHSRGALICLVSKNAERDVLEVFEKRTDMVLSLDEIVAHRINWDSKPHNIASLANSLNLGLDSFVFLDDNPVECALMQTELPQVLTLQIPTENEIESFLAHLWVFDKTNVTDEDARRTQMYKENAARQELEASAVDISEFIATLRVATDIQIPDETDWPRLAQLTQRTNQFNFTTIRRTENELRALADSGFNVLRVKVQDRFGDYGLVGLVVARAQTRTLSVDTLLLSCRVLGRGVEHAILRYLGELAKDLKLPTVEMLYIPTPKNEPARAFVDAIAAKFGTQQGDHVVYPIPTDEARALAHRPGHDPEAVVAASRSAEANIAIAAGIKPETSQSDRYALLAQRLTTGRDVQIALNSLATRERTLPGNAASATSEIEQRMLALWEEILGVRGLGVDDDYFATGGSSLLAASLFAEIVRRFGVKLPLTTILNSPTVRSLSRQIEMRKATPTDTLIELKRGSSLNLFLVHDGDGETLLYANLARRLPIDMAVFGLQPRHVANVPLAHTRIEDMAASYVELMRTRQPHGPYLLGGMCAGGVIAYEMACQLVCAGEHVDAVVILDAATPQATRRTGRIAKQRMGRFARLFAENSVDEVSLVRRLGVIGGAVIGKIWNTVSWEVNSFYTRWSVRARFWLLQKLLARRWPWPRIISGLTVRQIYECAEASYIPKPLSETAVILVRAKIGEAGDTPYVDIYSDQTLGWATVTSGLTIADVDGGHFSMLQEPFVRSLASILRSALTSEPKSDRTSVPAKEPA
jgi:FkbH-like protein